MSADAQSGSAGAFERAAVSLLLSRSRPLRLTVSTWNINSVRLRIDLVRRFLDEAKPDVLCLQETKCPDDRFP